MKYRIFYTSDFEKSVLRYDRTIRRRFDAALVLLGQDPFHPKLHTKPLAKPPKGFYSFRLGRDFRVIFVFKGSDTIHLLKIAKRGDVYR